MAWMTSTRSRRLPFAVLLVTLACTFAAQGAPTPPAERFSPTVTNAGIAQPALGRWDLTSYGMLFDFEPKAVAIYDRAGDLCWPDTSNVGMSSVNDLVPFFAKQPSHTTILFAASPDGTRYRAMSVPSIPVACTQRMDRTAPLYIFEAVTQSLIALYPFAREHHVDWAQRATAWHARAASARRQAELLVVLQGLFQGVEDPHTSISGELDGKRFRIRTFRGKDFKSLQQAFSHQRRYDLFLDWLFKSWMPGEYGEAAAALLGGTRHDALDKGLVWGRLEGNVGYLAINRMDGFGPDSDVAQDRALLAPALDQALTDLRDTRALVIDVSHNLGGEDEIAADVASRFADQVRPAYSKQAFHGGSVQSFETVPHQGIRYLKPLTLMTSELTASAAEVFTLRLRALPRVTQIGEPTQGVFSDATEKGLPNGWILSMSTEIYRDAQGQNHEGTGLLPDVARQTIGSDAAPHAYRDAIRAAGKRAQSQP